VELARLKYLAPRESVSGAKERKGGGRGGRGVSESFHEIERPDDPSLCVSEHLCRANWRSVITGSPRLFGEESNALRAKVTSLIAKGKQKIVHLTEGTDLASSVVCAQGGQAAPARRFP
jgi:hypothetical protein